MIKLENCSYRVNKTNILNNINLQINEGDRVAILGPNGAGKTTLVNMLTGNINPSSGTRELGDLQSIDKTKICYVMQHEVLPTNIKVKEALQLFAKHSNNKTASELMVQFNMQKKYNSLFRQLSGGEQQKLNLICSLQNKPQYFFVDEVTTGLDTNSRNQLI